MNRADWRRSEQSRKEKIRANRGVKMSQPAQSGKISVKQRLGTQRSKQSSPQLKRAEGRREKKSRVEPNLT